MGEKRTVGRSTTIPQVVKAPQGVLGVLDDLSSMILGQLATHRKLQAILETLSDHIEVDSAWFVLGCELGGDGDTTASLTNDDDHELTAFLRSYPRILESISNGTGTVVENNGTLGRSMKKGAPGSSLSVPVCLGGGIVGLLCVSTSRGQGRFSPWEVDFCSILANMAGASLASC